MTTARVIPFFPHAVGRREAQGGREPQSPFRHLMHRRELTPREIVHRRRMLATMYAKRADLEGRPSVVIGARLAFTADRRAESTTGRG
jgi:hypothetical protein